MQRAGEETALPAMYLGELMCLAFGLEEEMAAGLSQHRISVQPFVAKWKRLQEGRDEAYERFDLSAIETCLECRACADDCAPHLMDPGFDPHEVLEKIRDGRLEEALGDPRIWMCTECYECVERCFQNFGMLKALRTLKQLAIERGLAPKAVRSGLQAFHRSGMLTKAAKGPRQKLGLPDPPATGAKELRKLLSRRERDAPAQRELDLSGCE
jgi:heterodisulfide reductase subunit C